MHQARLTARMAEAGRRATLGVMLMGWLAAGCRPAPGKPTTRSTGDGDPERGRRVSRDYGCHTCHSIPGVDGPRSLVGPPLDGWSRRTYIAGRLHNTPENLVKWIEDPKAVDPRTAMPDVNVPTRDARDIAAYLLTLD